MKKKEKNNLFGRLDTIFFLKRSNRKYKFLTNVKCSVTFKYNLIFGFRITSFESSTLDFRSYRISKNFFTDILIIMDDCNTSFSHH